MKVNNDGNQYGAHDRGTVIVKDDDDLADAREYIVYLTQCSMTCEKAEQTSEEIDRTESLVELAKRS